MSKQPVEIKAHILKRFIRTCCQEDWCKHPEGYWVFWNPHGELNHTHDLRSAFVFGVEDGDGTHHAIYGEWTVVTLEDHMRDMRDQAAEHEAMAKELRSRCAEIDLIANPRTISGVSLK